MITGILCLVLGAGLLIYGWTGLRRGRFWGNLYEITRENLPHQFYRTVIGTLVIGIFWLIMGIVVMWKYMEK